MQKLTHEQIARIAYAALRQFRFEIDNMNLVQWDGLTDQIRESFKQDISARLENPTQDPEKIQPVLPFKGYKLRDVDRSQIKIFLSIVDILKTYL